MKKLLGTFEKFKKGLAKTRDNLVGKLNQILTGKSSIDESLLEEIREILLLSDVGYEITENIILKLTQTLKGKNVFEKDEVINIVKQELSAILNKAENKVSGLDFQNFQITDGGSTKSVMIVGVNGTGKTTSIGKIAYNFKQNNYKVLIAAADTFRAAANEQLSIWAKRASVEIIENKNTTDPGAIVYEALDTAIKHQIDLILIDTAGRLHTKIDLMNELNKIIRIFEKKLNKKPDEVLLVIDATTGQNAVIQIDSFLKYVPLTGLILTKLDGTAKGGVIFQIVNKFKLPVKFIGVGEGIEDLQPFDSQEFINAIFEN